MLFRQTLGLTLRRRRVSQQRGLIEVAAAAHISYSHLSEIERGMTEASSELLAAVIGALDDTPARVFREVADRMAAR